MCTDKQIYKEIGILESMDENGKIKIPGYIKNIKIDVGLSYSAPNSALWLKKFDDRMVFGFEPNPECIQHLMNGTNRNPKLASLCLSRRVIRKDGRDIKSFGENFKLFQCALSNVNSPEYRFFYMTDVDPGCSSLNKPSNLPYPIKKKIKVPVINLSDFLSKIPWTRFPFIEHMKTDAQGEDLEILKSAREYLSKIVFLQVENSTGDEYFKSHTEKEIHDFLTLSGFKLLEKIGVDSKYINKSFLDSEHLKFLDNSVI